MPSLNDFYANAASNENLNDVRWNVLAWLLSISNADLDKLKLCDDNFRTACTTLLVLVQVKLKFNLHHLLKKGMVFLSVSGS